MKCTLIGHPLGHSLSPDIHTRLFALSGTKGEYDLTDIPKELLEKKVEYLKTLDGFNITIPYKTDIIPYLSSLDKTAERYGAVNCVSVKDGKMTGYNTDCIGFIRSLEKGGLSLSGKVLLLGCGGVGRMMACEFLLHSAELTVAVLPEEIPAAEKVIADMKNSENAKVISLSDISGEFDLCANATPVGMFPKVDVSPVSEKIVSSCKAAFDVIYNPVETKLMKMFENEGKKAVGGMAMLVYQAVAAHEIWYGAKFDENDINSIISQMNEKIKNN